MSQSMDVSISSYSRPAVLYCSQYDVGRTIEITLTDENGFYNIPVASTVKIEATKPSGFGFSETCDFVGSTVTVETTYTMTNEGGQFPAELRVLGNGAVLGTANFLMCVEESPHKVGVIDGDESVVVSLTIRVETLEGTVAQNTEDISALRGDLDEYKGYFTGNIGDAVDKWMDAHPEATTTVPDGSITVAKFASSVVDKTLTQKGHPADAEQVGQLTALVTKKDLVGKAVAHRGYGWSSVTLPLVCENTIRAFSIAHDNGYDVIETDVQKDVNGVICCFHDSSVDTLTDGTGAFKNYAYTDLHLKDGYGTVTTENPTTFLRACQWAAANNVILDVEIKTGSTYYNVVSIAEVLSIADLTQAKVIINCQDSQALLNECQDDYPFIWKNTNIYKTQEITNSLVDSIVESGYTNLCVYIQQGNATTAQEVKYAYEHGIIVMRRVSYYSTTETIQYGMTFSENGRPNWEGEFIYDSGWITPDQLEGDFQNVDGYDFKYRQVNGIVYLHGIIKNTTWEAIPTSASNGKRLFKLPFYFRPISSHRGVGHIGDHFVGFTLIHIPVDGYILPVYKVSDGVTVSDLNSYNYTVFTSFPCVVPVG